MIVPAFSETYMDLARATQPADCGQPAQPAAAVRRGFEERASGSRAAFAAKAGCNSVVNPHYDPADPPGAARAKRCRDFAELAVVSLAGFGRALRFVDCGRAGFDSSAGAVNHFAVAPAECSGCGPVAENYFEPELGGAD